MLMEVREGGRKREEVSTYTQREEMGQENVKIYLTFCTKGSSGLLRESTFTPDYAPVITSMLQAPGC